MIVPDIFTTNVFTDGFSVLVVLFFLPQSNTLILKSFNTSKEEEGGKIVAPSHLREKEKKREQ